MTNKKITTPPVRKTPNVPQKLVVYILPAKVFGHKALTVRRMARNAKGRYVTGPQIALLGLLWGPGGHASREVLASKIGELILDEAGV